MMLKSIGDIIYPRYCLHCNEKLTPDYPAPYLCLTCTELLDPLLPEGRCTRCFHKDYHKSKQLCARCLKTPSPFDKSIGLFEYYGPAATLVKKLKYSYKPDLAEGMGAYMAARYLQLGYPKPDVIIPVPITISHWIIRSYNQSDLLARSLGSLLRCPVDNVLTRDNLDLSQAGLSHTQRLALSNKSFRIKKGKKIEGKILLLIDDVSTTGATLHRCGEALLEKGPSKLLSMSFCLA